MKLLLMVMAVIEGFVGIAMLVVPAITISSLLATPLDTPGGLVVGRLAGAALISLGVACWQARNSERGGSATGVVAGMFFYNGAAAALLVYAGVRLGLQSPLIWPAILLHTALALSCLLNLRITKRKLSNVDDAEPVGSDS